MVVYVTYGKSISGIHDEYVTGSEFALEGISKAMIPGFFWIEYLPFLQHLPKWVPGQTWRREVEKYLPVVRKMIDQPFYEVKAAMVRCFANKIR